MNLVSSNSLPTNSLPQDAQPLSWRRQALIPFLRDLGAGEKVASLERLPIDVEAESGLGEKRGG